MRLTGCTHKLRGPNWLPQAHVSEEEAGHSAESDGHLLSSA